MSISAILAKAFSTTLLGMGTVFALLIVISLIIGCLLYTSAYEAEHGQAASGDDYVVRNIRRIRHEAK